MRLKHVCMKLSLISASRYVVFVMVLIVFVNVQQSNELFVNVQQACYRQTF